MPGCLLGCGGCHCGVAPAGSEIGGAGWKVCDQSGGCRARSGSRGCCATRDGIAVRRGPCGGERESGGAGYGSVDIGCYLYEVSIVGSCVCKLFVDVYRCGSEVVPARGGGQDVRRACAAHFGGSGVARSCNGLCGCAGRDLDVAHQGIGQIVPFRITGLARGCF